MRPLCHAHQFRVSSKRKLLSEYIGPTPHPQPHNICRANMHLHRRTAVLVLLPQCRCFAGTWPTRTQAGQETAAASGQNVTWLTSHPPRSKVPWGSCSLAWAIGTRLWLDLRHVHRRLWTIINTHVYGNWAHSTTAYPFSCDRYRSGRFLTRFYRQMYTPTLAVLGLGESADQPKASQASVFCGRDGRLWHAFLDLPIGIPTHAALLS